MGTRRLHLLVSLLLAASLLAAFPITVSAQSCYGGYCGSGDGEDSETKAEVQVTITIEPADGGTVLVNGVEVAGGVFKALQGDTLTLEAVPNRGYTFERWTDWFSETTPHVEAPIYNHKTLVAHFVKEEDAPTPKETTPSANVIAIPQGTVALDAKGSSLTEVTVELRQPRALPTAGILIGDVYNLKPDGATFDPPLPVSLPYDISAIPAGVDEEALNVAVYDASAQDWIPLPSIVDTDAHVVNAEASHLSEFAVVAPTTPGVAASVPLITPGFSFSSLLVSPADPQVGQDMVATVLATYSGGNAQAHTRVFATLDGVLAAETEIVLSPGDQVPVRLSFQPPSDGSHTVEVNGLSETVVVAPARAASILTQAVELAEQDQFIQIRAPRESFFTRWSMAVYVAGALVLLLLAGPLLNAMRRRILRARYDL
jgi:hypothetical protein